MKQLLLTYRNEANLLLSFLAAVCIAFSVPVLSFIAFALVIFSSATTFIAYGSYKTSHPSFMKYAKEAKTALTSDFSSQVSKGIITAALLVTGSWITLVIYGIAAYIYYAILRPIYKSL